MVDRRPPRIQDNPVGHYVFSIRDFPSFIPYYAVNRPHEFWKASLGRLVDGPTSVSGPLPAPDVQYEVITLVLQQAVELGPKRAGDFITIGTEALLKSLETPKVYGDPSKIRALRNVAYTLQGLPSDMQRDGWKLPNLKPAHEYLYACALQKPDEILDRTFTRLAHPIFGVGQAADLGEVFGADLSGFYDFVHKTGNVAIQHRIYNVLENMLSRHLPTGANPTYLRATKNCFEKGFMATRSGSTAFTANSILNNSKDAARFMTEASARDAHRVFGRGTTADLSGAFDQTTDMLVSEIATKEPETQVAFLNGATDALSSNVVRILAKQPDRLAHAMYRHLELLTTSPIAVALEHADRQGGRAKETDTITLAQRYFIARLFGINMNDGGIEYLGHEPNPDLLKEVFNYVANSAEKNPKMARFAHTILADNRFRLLSNPTPENIAAFEASFIGATEKLTYALSNESVPVQTHYDYLHLVRLLSPQTYAELAVLMGGGSRLDKTTRYHKPRLKLAREAATRDTTAPFYAAYTASGKMIRTHIPKAIPHNDELHGMLTRAISENTVVQLTGDGDKLDGYGDGINKDGNPDANFEGPLFVFSDGACRIPKEELGNWQRSMNERGGQFFAQILGRGGRLSMPNFIETSGTRAGDFAPFELYVAGMLLRDIPGEEGGEEIKAQYREQYIPLLINILTDAAQPKGKQRFSPEMHTMVRHVAHDLLPFFSLETQKLFVEFLVDNTLWNDAALLDNSGIIQVLLPLGWNKDRAHGFPSVEGETSDGRRPIADYIVERSLNLLRNFSYVRGRRERRHLILECLMLTMDDLTKLDANALNEKIQTNWSQSADILRQGIVYQVASLLGPFGSREDHLLFAKAVEDVLLADMLKLAPFVAAMPLEVVNFTEMAKQVTAETLKALNQATTEITQTIMQISSTTSFDEGDLAGTFGEVPRRLRSLVDKVVKQAETTLEDIRKSTGLAKVEEKIGNVDIDVPTGTNTSALRDLLAAAAEGRLDMPVETMIKALEEIGRVTTIPAEGKQAVAAPSQGPNTLLVTGDQTYLSVAAALMASAHQNGAANALPLVADKILQYNQEVRQEALDLTRESGALTTVQQTEAVRQLVLSIVSHVLSNQSTRQEMIMGFNTMLEKEEAEVASNAKIVEITLNGLAVEAASEFTTEHVRDLRALITTQKRIQLQRRRAAQTHILALTRRINALAGIAARSTALGIDKTIQYADAQIDYLEAISEEGGKFAVLARAVAATLGLTDMPIMVILPTPDRLFGDAKTDYLKLPGKNVEADNIVEPRTDDALETNDMTQATIN